MSLCKICKKEFIPYSVSKVCSLKCRILEGCNKSENGCWLWKGAIGGKYGKTRWYSKTISAHKASFLVFKGEVLKGLHVCHHCDNPLCVNPEHLWLGTQKDNMRDSVLKGRFKGTLGIKWTKSWRENFLKNLHPANKKGEAHHLVKLSNEKVKEIRNLLNKGLKQKEIASKFRVCQSTIARIKRGRLWPHLV